MVQNVIQIKKGKNNKFRFESKGPVLYYVCQKDYVWIFSTHVCVKVVNT